MLVPRPPPRKKLWRQGYQEILAAHAESLPVSGHGRAAFCDMVARIAAARRDGTGPTKRADIVGLLYVAAKTGFDPQKWMAIPGRSLVCVGVSEGRKVLGRLVAGGYLKARPQSGNRANKYRLRPDDKPTVPVIPENANRFAAVIEQLVTSADHPKRRTPSAAPISDIPLTDVWLYVAVAADLDFQVGRPRRYDFRALARLSESAEAAIPERLERLHKAELLRCKMSGHELTVELIRTERTGTFWPRDTPRKRLRRWGSKKPKPKAPPTPDNHGPNSDDPVTPIAPKSEPTSKKEGRSPLDDLDDPVKLTWVVAQVGHAAGRSGNLARRMKGLGYRIRLAGNRNYCQRKDAETMFPQAKSRLQEGRD